VKKKNKARKHTQVATKIDRQVYKQYNQNVWVRTIFF